MRAAGGRENGLRHYTLVRVSHLNIAVNRRLLCVLVPLRKIKSDNRAALLISSHDVTHDLNDFDSTACRNL